MMFGVIVDRHKESRCEQAMDFWKAFYLLGCSGMRRRIHIKFPLSGFIFVVCISVGQMQRRGDDMSCVLSCIAQQLHSLLCIQLTVLRSEMVNQKRNVTILALSARSYKTLDCGYRIQKMKRKTFFPIDCEGKTICSTHSLLHCVLCVGKRYIYHIYGSYVYRQCLIVTASSYVQYILYIHIRFHDILIGSFILLGFFLPQWSMLPFSL